MAGGPVWAGAQSHVAASPLAEWEGGRRTMVCEPERESGRDGNRCRTDLWRACRQKLGGRGRRRVGAGIEAWYGGPTWIEVDCFWPATLTTTTGSPRPEDPTPLRSRASMTWVLCSPPPPRAATGHSSHDTSGHSSHGATGILVSGGWRAGRGLALEVGRRWARSGWGWKGPHWRTESHRSLWRA